MTFVEAEHPRARGRFAEKQQNAPQLTLDRPAGDDLSRLAALGFPVTSDQHLLGNYSVEPGIWRQSITAPDMNLADLNEAQRRTINLAAGILDSRRGARDPGARAPWHRADCYAEDFGGIAVYIRSRAETWTEDTRTLRVLVDSVGGVADVRESSSTPHTGPIWNEL